MKSTKGINDHASVNSDTQVGHTPSDLNFIDELENQHRSLHDATLIENLPTAIYTCDASGRITMFNSAAAMLWGRTPKIGHDLWCGSYKLYQPDMTPIDLDKCPMAITLREGRAVRGQEVILERPDGSFINVLPHPKPLFTADGKLRGAVNMLVDISELKRTRVALAKSEGLTDRNKQIRKSEHRYQQMVLEIQEYAILLLDENGIIQNWNKGAEAIKGYRSEEAIGKSFTIFYPENDIKNEVPNKLLARSIKDGRAADEGWRIRKDGSRFWGSITITALHDDDNKVIGFTKVTRDLSERKATEEALLKNALELQRKNEELELMNQELTSFAYVSSHDLQEPLRKIQTFASRIMESEAELLSERGKDYFGRMQNAAMRMQILIEDLLTYSRTNTDGAVFEMVDLNLLIQDIKDEVKERLDEQHGLIESTSLPVLSVIRFQFHQLFTNIIGNALKFSKPGVPPVIKVSARITDGENIQHPKRIANQNYHHISISDNGIGFDPEHSVKIFEVFHRLHGRSEYKGTGIGLAICKKIIDHHHGLISAHGEEGKGAIFNIYIPVEK